MQKRVLVVAKDRGSLAVVAPIASVLQKAGAAVMCATEGDATILLPTYDLSCMPTGTLSPREILKNGAPDVVLVGCSAPMNLERTISEEARLLSIPLVVVADVRSAWKRHNEEYLRGNLILTTDDEDAELARDLGAESSSIGFHQLIPPPSSKKTEKEIERYKAEGKVVILYATGGQARRTPQELECVLKSSRQTKKDHVLVIQPHPKLSQQMHPSGGRWLEWFEHNAKSAVFLSGPVVLYADMAISPSSQALTAYSLGKIGVGLRCASVYSELSKEPGALEQLKFYESCGMPILERPRDLSTLLSSTTTVMPVQPLDAQRGATAIELFLTQGARLR